MTTLRYEAVVLLAGLLLGILVGVLCVFVPAVRAGHSAGPILNSGVLIGMLIGGYAGFRAPTATTRPVRVTLTLCYGGVTVILVYVVSLLIILNVVGSWVEEPRSHQRTSSLLRMTKQAAVFSECLLDQCIDAEAAVGWACGAERDLG